MSRLFQSWLAPRFERFVAIKRAGGADYGTQERLLADFDRYLAANAPASPLRRKTVLGFLASLDRLSLRARDNVIDVVWQAVALARRKGECIDTLPPRPPRAPAHYRVRPPRFISHQDIGAVIVEARRLSPDHTLRSATYATLYGLLFASGIRIGEALSLDIDDLDFRDGLLTVRNGKFGKSRVLPLRGSTVSALERYVNDPRRPVAKAATDPLFVSRTRRRLSHPIAYTTFKTLWAKAAIGSPPPCLHDFRHSFAVLTILRWYQEQSKIDALLPVLSSYLGHVSVENTRVYLQANGLLLEEASRRFSHKCARMDEVLS